MKYQWIAKIQMAKRMFSVRFAICRFFKGGFINQNSFMALAITGAMS